MTEKIVLAIGACFCSASMILIRYGGKDLDFSKGFYHVISNGYLWILGMLLGWVAGLSFACVVTRMEISTAVSYYVPLTYLITFCAAVFLLKEPITLHRVIGGVCIVIGLYFIH